MARWNIDPDGVRRVVVDSGKSAAALGASAESFAGSLEPAAIATGSEIIAEALAGFSQSRQSSLEFIGDRYERAVTAGVDATTFYLQGDEEMALAAQRRVTSSAWRGARGRSRAE